jgi:hypothetical protein
VNLAINRVGRGDPDQPYVAPKRLPLDDIESM